MNHRPRRRFGQNFLIDRNIINNITRVIAPQQNEPIIEIGPGKGALTESLLSQHAAVYAIEIDRDLCVQLREKYKAQLNFHLFEADALKLDFETLITQTGAAKIVGNIPYNITSPLLFKIFELGSRVSSVVFLVQREIAQRICALPNTKEYGILTVLANFYGNAQITFHVSPQVFRPRPQVWSSLLTFKPLPNEFGSDFRRAFHLVVKKAFNQRRKTLKNALSELLPDDITDSPVDLQRRAESLTCTEFISLTHFLLPQIKT